MNMIFEGEIIDITDIQPFAAKDGSSHIERYLVVKTTDEPYPQRAAVRVIDQNASREYQIGDRVRCYLQLQAAQGLTGRWFTTLRAWNVSVFRNLNPVNNQSVTL